MDQFDPPALTELDEAMDVRAAVTEAARLAGAQCVSVILLTALSNGMGFQPVYRDLLAFFGAVLAGALWRLAWRRRYGSAWSWTVICLGLLSAVLIPAGLYLASEPVMTGSMNLLQVLVAVIGWGVVTLMGVALGQAPRNGKFLRR